MNLNQLCIFVAVIEERGISAAARKLNLSPTAVSKQMKSLEDTLGAQLVLRTTTRFTVTDIGNRFYEECKRLLREADKLFDVVHSYRDSPRGNLKIFSSIAFAHQFIVPRVEEFQSRFPDVTVEFDVADRIPDVQGEVIDLCFGLIGHWDLNLIRKRLFKTRAGIYASPDYLRRHPAPATLADLHGHKHICHNKRPDSQVITFEDEPSVHIQQSVSVNDHESLLGFARNGLGLVVLFDFIAEALVAKKELKQVLANVKMPQENYYVFYAPTQYLKPAARAFLEFVVQKTNGVT